MALAFNPEVTAVLWNRQISREERIGHLMAGREFVRTEAMQVEEVLRLRSLLKWATGVDVPGKLNIEWCSSARLAKLSFLKRDYFNGGNKYFAAVTAAKTAGARRFLSLSAPQLDFWIFHFAHKVEEGGEKEEKTEEVTPATPVTSSAPAPTPPRVVRNVRRREKPQYTEVPLEDDDE